MKYHLHGKYEEKVELLIDIEMEEERRLHECIVTYIYYSNYPIITLSSLLLISTYVFAISSLFKVIFSPNIFIRSTHHKTQTHSSTHCQARAFYGKRRFPLAIVPF